MVPTRSERAALLARPDLDGPRRRAALTKLCDEWLAGLAPQLSSLTGVALVAVGGLGRREPAPYGDLDLVLVHGGQEFIGDLADRIWYPIWDAGEKLDHSVRTVGEAVAVAETDVRAAVGLLDARHVAGDAKLTAGLLDAARTSWRHAAKARLAELRQRCLQRWDAQGEVAHLLEPDLKEGRGGLRDVGALRAVATAQIVDVHWRDVRAAHGLLLDVRDGLHLCAGRSLDRLLLQEQDAVADRLKLPDADALMQSVAAAARRVAFALDASWRAVDRWSGTRRGVAYRPMAVRRPLAEGVVEQDGEVHLGGDAAPGADPVLGLRLGAVAARADLPIGAYALDRLTAELAPMPEPWSEAARNTLVTLLGSGPPLVATWEALDHHDLLGRMLPEWESVRSRPQRNPVHRYTVDRHLVATAVEAGALTRRVGRPDLLLLGALLHDIGKGRPGDHVVNGEQMVARIAPRLGLSSADAETLVKMVRHHLLLPETATRRDLDDPATIDTVLVAVDGSIDLLDLLHALTVADAAATGPAAWSDWKADLVEALVERVRALAHGDELPGPPPVDEALLARARAGETVVWIDGAEVVITTADSVGLLSRAAGALSLPRLDVLAAGANSVDGMAYLRFDVRPQLGSLDEPAWVAADIRRAVVGELPLQERLAARQRAYARPRVGAAADPIVLWFDDAATDAVVLELRAADRIGLLHEVTAALERSGAEIRSARVATLGGDVVDAFALAGGDRLDRAKVEGEVLAAAGG